MRYVVPHEITEFSTNVAKQDYTEYSPNTTYNVGDTCTILSENKNYKCTKDNTQNKNPKDNPTLWISEPTNANAMLVYTSSKKTINENEINISFRVKNIDFIALFGVEASNIRVKVTDMRTNTIIYNKDKNMFYDDLQNFGDYLFAPRELKEKLNTKFSKDELLNIFANFSKTEIRDRLTANPPIYFDVRVEISIKNPNSQAKCGYMCCGRGRELGISLQNGASTGLKSYTKKERDEWGNVNLIKGAIFDVMDIPVLIDSENLDLVKERFKKIDATPCVFIADESNAYTSLTIFGFYKDLEMPISKNKTNYTLRVESILS